jgi:hypothetical protein
MVTRVRSPPCGLGGTAGAGDDHADGGHRGARLRPLRQQVPPTLRTHQTTRYRAFEEMFGSISHLARHPNATP